jgi:eukaryotic-like serine/threonine-protein kinase
MSDVASELNHSLAGRYRIEREIGRGGMAVVYLAEDLKHARRVAIKVLDPELARALGAERFLREIEIAARLSHPRIVPLLDSGSAGGLLYYVMPYVEGESLRDRLDREQQLPVGEAVEIARQAAAALAYAHEHGIVHRDVKPENILLSGGEAMVADFGIARAVAAAGGTKLTQSGLVVGTPLYMSPEQASGVGHPDARSDVYSLACVLYEMLAGEPPFAGRTAQAVTARKLSESAPEVRAVRDSTPGPVAAVVRRALARVPADRYRTAAELAEALRRAENEGAADPAVAARGRGASGWRAVAVGSGAALLLITTAYVAGWSGRAPGPGLFVELVVDGRVELGSRAALSPDGRRLAYLSGDRLWVRDLEGLDSRTVPGSDGARMPFWSPDATELGYVARGRLWRAPAAGGESVAIATIGIGLAGGAGATWTGDGQIVFATGSTGLLTVPARGGVPRLLVPLEPDETDHHEPHALPGGQGILFVPHRIDGTYALDIVADGERRELLRLDGHRIGEPVYSPTGHLLFTLSEDVWAVPFSLRRLEITGEPSLLRPGASTPSVAAGGSLAFFRGAGTTGRQLAFVQRDGAVDRLVGDPSAGLQFFSLSPAGDRVAVALMAPLGIWVIDPIRGTRSRPTEEGEAGNMPRWSPAGERIAYIGSDPGDAPAVRVRAADGTGSASELVRGWYPSFTPRGELVVTLGLPIDDEEWDIAYIDLNADGAVIPIVASSARECCQDVSPDGRYLAYASDTSGRWEVYVTRFPSGEGTWQASAGGGAWPRWDPRGDRLYYAQGVDLMEIPVSTEPELELGSPARLFSRPARVQDIRYGKPDYFDITPGGDRFLVVVPATEDAVGGSVVVVGNWRAALVR